MTRRHRANALRENTPMAHEFLSDDWFAAVNALREKYADDAPKVPYSIRMNQVITGAPFTEDEIQLHLDTSDGTAKMDKGHLESPEITVTTDWETARKIFVEQDQAAGMQAFMSGKVKVQGDMMKMMQMNAVPADDFAKKMAAEVKALTA
jgi:putative sterol carrier protein